jgi:hypothetical protein
MAHIEELARLAIDSGFNIHKEVGPGLLESVYEAILAASLLAEDLLSNDRSLSRLNMMA